MPNKEFLALVDKMPELQSTLLVREAWDISMKRYVLEEPGVYVLSKNKIHMYVGLAGNLRTRYGHQATPGSRHSALTLAMSLAREDAKRHDKSRGRPDTREKLIKDPSFTQILDKNIIEVGKMGYRFIVVEDAVLRYLLEAYLMFVLKTPYNQKGRA